MKKLYFALVAIMVLSFALSGCGKEEVPESLQDIRAETQQMSNVAEGVDTSEMFAYDNLGIQFWENERIQLYGERKPDGGGVYFHKEDGSRELLAEGVDMFWLSAGKWWIDSEKRCFLLKSNGILRVGSDGTAVFNIEGVSNVNSICQLTDGRLIVLRWGDSSHVLSELDPDTGAMKDYQDIRLTAHGQPMITAEEDKVLLLDSEGLWEVNLTQKTVASRLSFTGTSYTLKNDEPLKREKEDFRLNEGEEIELLWSDGTAELLKLEQVSAEKEILVLRSASLSSWLKEQIVKFNQENQHYYISLEEADAGEWSSFLERTDLDLSVGKGADIICSDGVNDAYSLLEKGAFEDLAPYMAKSGMREEDYFPATFSGWKYNDGIYGLTGMIKMEGLWIMQDVIGETEPSDLEALTDCLLGYDQDAVFFKYTSPSALLKLLLKDSENLGGLVDLENGTCDFGGELFEKLLKTAERYGYDERKAYDAIAGLMYYDNFYNFLDRSNLESMEKAPLGYWFDSGWHTEVYSTGANSAILAINSSSSKKEGAWEFLRFLLGSEVQSGFLVNESDYLKASYFPVDKNAFEELCGKHKKSINYGYDIKTTSKGELINNATGLTEDRKTELKAALETARTVPIRIIPLLDIILEEAEGYFSGVRSLDDVRSNTQNRVQLYLDEH